MIGYTVFAIIGAVYSEHLIYSSIKYLLGSISSGDKVSIKGNLLTVEKIHPFLCIKRKFNGDSRNDVFQLLNDLFDMSDYHLKEQNDKKNN